MPTLTIDGEKWQISQLPQAIQSMIATHQGFSNERREMKDRMLERRKALEEQIESFTLQIKEIDDQIPVEDLKYECALAHLGNMIIEQVRLFSKSTQVPQDESEQCRLEGF